MKEITICSSWFSSFDFRIIGCCHDWFGRKWHPLNYRLEVSRFPYTAFRTKSIRYEIPLCFEYQSQPFIGSRLQAIARFPYSIPLYSTKLSCILTLRQTVQLHIVNVYFNFIVLILSIKSYPDFVDQFIPRPRVQSIWESYSFLSRLRSCVWVIVQEDQKCLLMGTLMHSKSTKSAGGCDL